MKILFVGSLIFLVTVVHNFPFPRPTGPDFPPFPSSLPGDNFFGESASSRGEGIDGFRGFGIGCSGKPGFPDGFDEHDGFDMSEGGFHREEHEGGGGPPFMMGDGFDVGSMSGADASALGGGEGPPFMMGSGFDGSSMARADASAGADANAGLPFLGSGANGALGSAIATASADAGTNVGPESAQSVAQTKSETISAGNGAFSSATSFSAASDT